MAFTIQTIDEIMEEQLSNVDDKYEKTVGSNTYDILKPSAIQIQYLQQLIYDLSLKLSVGNLTGTELDQKVFELAGLTRNASTKAVGVLSITGNGDITIGDLFETTGGVQFQSIETKTITGSGTIQIQAVLGGSSGNVGTGLIIEQPVQIPGITDVTNLAPTTGGNDEETDQALQQRYYEKIQEPATSGNVYHYKLWVKEVDGVGDVQVLPTFNGTTGLLDYVKLVVIDTNKQPAAQSILDEVIAYVDPNQNGDGTGQAPIGAITQFVAATPFLVNVSYTATLNMGYTLLDAKNQTTDVMIAYFKDIAFQESLVSYAILQSLILNIPAISDLSNFTMNGGQVSITIPNENVPITGTVTVV